MSTHHGAHIFFLLYLFSDWKEPIKLRQTSRKLYDVTSDIGTSFPLFKPLPRIVIVIPARQDNDYGNTVKRRTACLFIKFCVNLGKTPTETKQLLEQANNGRHVSRQLVVRCHKEFRDGRKSAIDKKRRGRPSVIDDKLKRASVRPSHYSKRSCRSLWCRYGHFSQNVNWDTCNVSDFGPLGTEIIDGWSGRKPGITKSISIVSAFIPERRRRVPRQDYYHRRVLV